MADNTEIDWAALSRKLATLPKSKQEEEPQPSASWNKLFSLLATDVHDRYYKGQVIYLDGYTFTNCCFHNCTLVTNAGLFSLQSCTLLNSNLQLGANAIRIVKLFNIYTPSAWPAYNPTMESDGSVTIG